MGTIASINGVDDGNIVSRNGINPRFSISNVSLSPALTVSTAPFGVLIVDIAGARTAYTNPNWAVECTLADGTVTVADSNIDRNLADDLAHVGGKLFITDTNTSTAERTITARGQEFGDKIQSTSVTGTYTPVFPQKQFIRVQGCDEDGTNNNTRISFREIRFYDGIGQSGTEYPATDLTSNTSETGITITAGAFFNDTYAPFKAFGNAGSTQWWTLGNTNADLNFIEIEFKDDTYSGEDRPVLKSVMLNKAFDTNIMEFVKITGSDNADHSSATTFGIYRVPDKTDNSDVSEFDIG